MNPNFKQVCLMMMIAVAYTLLLPAPVTTQLPCGVVNFKSSTSSRFGLTDINIHWNAPGVKGREGKI